MGFPAESKVVEKKNHPFGLDKRGRKEVLYLAIYNRFAVVEVTK